MYQSIVDIKDRGHDCRWTENAGRGVPPGSVLLYHDLITLVEPTPRLEPDAGLRCPVA